MSIYALTSISGSPGVTTTAIAWATLSKRPTLIIEADPTGGSPIVAGVWAGQQPHTTSILELANRERARFVEYLHERSLVLPGTTDRRVLPGVPAPEHARPLSAVWRPLAAALRTISSEGGIDVVIDAGRAGAQHAPWTLMEGADALLVLTDTTLPALNSTAIGVASIRERLEQSGIPDRLGVVPITGRDRGPDIRPYGSREISGVIAPTRVIGDVPRDAARAGVYSSALSPGRGHSSSGYCRSIVHLTKAAEEHADRIREVLTAQEGIA
ncbi:MAG: hypothetical protein L0H31_14085 [Nocardioidaceae bacterium]|nr:hypothetical protein [Nocardioidaceae bacterium]